MSTPKFVMHVTVNGVTTEYVSHKSKTLNDALVEFARQIPDVSVEDQVGVTLVAKNEALQFDPPQFRLGEGDFDYNALLKPMEIRQPAYARKLALLRIEIERDPQFADLVDTVPYKQAVARIDNWVPGNDMTEVLKKVREMQTHLHDLIHRFIAERHIEKLTPRPPPRVELFDTTLSPPLVTTAAANVLIDRDYPSDVDPWLKPLDRNHPGYTRTLVLLCGRISFDPQFADLIDTEAYKAATQLPEGIVGGLDMDTLTHPREVMECFEQLHDLIQRFVTERHITRFTPPGPITPITF